jgi:hypothetical protein
MFQDSQGWRPPFLIPTKHGGQIVTMKYLIYFAFQWSKQQCRQVYQGRMFSNCVGEECSESGGVINKIAQLNILVSLQYLILSTLSFHNDCCMIKAHLHPGHKLLKPTCSMSQYFQHAQGLKPMQEMFAQPL